jgi:hypothetical protein
MRTPALLSLFLTACPGVTGDPGDDDGSSQRCQAETTVLELDEVSGLGFSAREMLEYVAGPRTETIGYGEHQPSSTITVEVIHGGGEVRYVDQEEPDGGFFASAKETAWADPCPDYLEVDVEISLVSADGLWNERYPSAIISGERYYLAESTEQFMIEDLSGSYTPWHFDLDAYEGAEVTIDIDFDHRGTRGQIHVFALEACDDGLCLTEGMTPAHWPED